MAKIFLNLVIHNHQPIGNFGNVFEAAYKDCYSHIINILEAHKSIKLSMHISGPLLDWLLDNQKEHIAKIVKLAKSGQLEIVGGGYYEPIIAILREEDAIGQIKMMTKKWEDLTGIKPKGMWVAERVWEPSLPVVLKKSGVEYVVLDDEHFFSAGLDKKAPLTGYYNTERQGYSVSVFPSDKGLRYRIPFWEVEKVISYLTDIANNSQKDICITYGDDGEKFGVWPRTYRSVIEEKWLDRFFSALETNKDKIETTTLSESYSMLQSEGLIYLPTASYAEMLEWAMPADSILQYEKLKNFVDHNDELKSLNQYVKGGFWDNFLVKYPESNHVHKRIMYVSERLSKESKKLPADIAEEIRLHIYKAQCNCAYWHGLFGGVYLNHLRHGLYENLIKAESKLEAALNSPSGVRTSDFDFDGKDELSFSNSVYAVFIDPEMGGSAVEIDYRGANINVVNVLSRRKEAYHNKLKKASERPHHEDYNAAVSIHDMPLYVNDDDLNNFAYDKYRRFAFMEHVVPLDTNLNDLRSQKYMDLGIDAMSPYTVKKITKSSVSLQRDSFLVLSNMKIPVRFDKMYSFSDIFLEMTLGVMNNSEEFEVEFMLLLESSLNLLAGYDQSRYILIDGVRPDNSYIASSGVTENCEKLTIVDDGFNFSLHYGIDRKAKLMRYPVETIALSEKGGEKTYQGTSYIYAVPVLLSPGQGLTTTVKMSFTGRNVAPSAKKKPKS